MEITLLASGSEKLRLDDHDGNIPWSHLNSFQEFLTERISGKNVIIGKKAFEIDFLKKLIHQAYAYPIIVAREEKFSLNSVQVVGFTEALDFLKINRVHTEVMVLGGTQTFKDALPYSNKVEYFQIDHNPRGLSEFPSSLKTDFKRVSLSPSSEVVEKDIFRIEIQKWLRKPGTKIM